MKTNIIYNEDCLEGIKRLPNKSIDLILTDPPYNASNFKREFKNKSYYPINEEWDKNFTLDYIKEITKKSKDNGSLLLFCSHHNLPEICLELKQYIKIKQFLHWIKTNPFPSVSNVYTFSVEYIIFSTNGKNYWGNSINENNKGGYIFNKNKNIKKDTFHYPTVSGKERTKHKAQKPLLLIKKLLETHSNKNDIILDPFMGSGTTAIACKRLNRKYIGFEISKEYYKIARERIEAEKTLWDVPKKTKNRRRR